MSARLTDEELADVAARIVDDNPKCHQCGGVDSPEWCVCDGTGMFALGTSTVRTIIAEVRELRALLATAWPCGWPEPEQQPFRDGTCGVAWEPLDADVDADEAIALGAALVRAGLAAKGNTP